jgi:hypothetical protein
LRENTACYEPFDFCFPEKGMRDEGAFNLTEQNIVL